MAFTPKTPPWTEGAEERKAAVHENGEVAHSIQVALPNYAGCRGIAK